jgi:hypothetical protein
VDHSEQERLAEVEALRLLANFQRNPTWKKIETILRDRRDVLEMEVGQTGLTDTDRAMLHGKLALALELLWHVPRQIVERELADRSPSLEADDLTASLPDPARKPEIF